MRDAEIKRVWMRGVTVSSEFLNNPLLEAIGVHFFNLPARISEQVVCNEDGSYTIIINARLSYEQQMEAYKHAITHIMNDDFSKENADEIEKAV